MLVMAFLPLFLMRWRLLAMLNIRWYTTTITDKGNQKAPKVLNNVYTMSLLIVHWPGISI